ncbi:HHR063Wp [Eremothecium sinecaudum]|uniref:HHR063Wp n=1 Tax=Eremothecium sinecaudum TaxID=45286 RepID=A0A109V0I3_9SACH|nr:HHR063Wp [Eremothecium sinecaudum]AMD22832.1 HHR063Wp [Eremothecium sinecaudum]
MTDGSADLLTELKALREENKRLRSQLTSQHHEPHDRVLSNDEYIRYGRQMIVEGTGGVEGQMKLKNAKVLVVGAGGLGCPSILYLAAAGVGTIGIVDDDVVDVSNLHRQIMHNTSRVGVLKCESAKLTIRELNPFVEVVTHPVRLSSQNAFEIFSGYDIVLDCTDNPMPRYLISDVAVNLGLTVVSGSGLGSEGQLTIYNFKNFGPCYRCFYPNPPPAGTVTSCEAGGVIGPCIGTIGVMMACETLKLILDVYTEENFFPFIMHYSAFPIQKTRTFKMRGRRAGCISCSSARSITQDAIEGGMVDYSVLCGGRNFDVCSPEERINVRDFHERYSKCKGKDLILIDVRQSLQYAVTHLPNSYNVSLNDLMSMEGDVSKLEKAIPGISTSEKDVFIMCRRGNESRLALRLLKDNFKVCKVRDIIGGYFQYIEDGDPSLPPY